MTYIAETRTDTSKAKHLLEITAISILKHISEKALLDKIRSEDIRKSCKIEGKWITLAKNRIERICK
jgi:hypothetical protein